MKEEYNNNRLQRIHYLDKLLSDRKGGYSISQIISILTEKTNQRIDRFMITRDIKFLETRLNALITKEVKKIYRGHKSISVIHYYYTDPEFSLFCDTLTDLEKDFLGKALSMLGLKGISATPYFRGLHLKSTSKDTIISFTKNPDEGKYGNLFASLYEYIKRREPISFRMHDRNYPYEEKNYKVHPWYLREYNRRWYMFGKDMITKKITRYALDRIHGSIRPLKKKYEGPDKTMDKILENIIGVSLTESEPIEIIFWVSDESADYVKRKRLHSTQEEIEISMESSFYKMINYELHGKFFKMKCENNYELRREMISFGAELIVLSPDSFRKEIKRMIQKMADNYT